jgi:hypothetical protein
VNGENGGTEDEKNTIAKCSFFHVLDNEMAAIVVSVHSFIFQFW